jgi:hypothetical protein
VTPIKKKYNLPLEAGDIKDGGIYHIRYDGVNFQMPDAMGVTASAAEINRLDGISLTDDIITLEQLTKALWYQDVAPNGWAIVAAVDDHAVSLTKGSVASGIEGGTATGTNVFSAQFVDLATDEENGHTHGVSGTTSTTPNDNTKGGDTNGTSALHAHTFSVTSNAGSAHDHQVDLDVARAHCIIAELQ